MQSGQGRGGGRGIRAGIAGAGGRGLERMKVK